MPSARFRFLPVLAVAMLAVVLAGCGNSYEWNQKVTVTIETPQGERSGSSVMLARYDAGIPFIVGDARGGGFRLQGEAPTVDLGGGRYLFATLAGMARLPFEVLAGGRGGVANARRTIMRTKGSQDVPARLYPMLVTFANLSDPASVRRIDPDDLDAALGCTRNATGNVDVPWRAAGKPHAQWIKDETRRLANERASAHAGITGRAAAALEEYYRIARPSYGPNAADKRRLEELSRSFTTEQRRQWVAARKSLLETIPGTLPTVEAFIAARGGSTCYRIKNITLEITREPVTAGTIEKVLGWWCELRKARSRLNGRTGPISDNELSNNLGTGAFRIGDCT